MLLRQICHELERGPLDADSARALREGKLASSVCIQIALDAMSVFAAVTATHIKIPAEKSLLSHVQYVRELLDRSIIHSLLWFDTRDMGADGMTKGSVDRKAITSIMSGSNLQEHPFRVWRPSASASNPSYLERASVSEAVSAEDTANSSEVTTT